MADQETDKQLDQLLDSLLSQYSTAEPRPGLETRILAQIAEARSAGNGHGFGLRWLWVGAASAGVLALIVLLTFFSGTSQKNESPTRIARTQPQTAGKEPIDRTTTARKRPLLTAAPKRKIRKVGQAATVEIRQQVFPTPVPLSEQERLMFTYVASTPHAEVVAQIERDDEKEAEAFWRDREPQSGTRRSAPTR